MADNFISGVSSYVKFGAVAYQFNEWKIGYDGGVKKFFAFGSNAQRTLPGGIAAQPEVTGPYDAGNMPIVLNQLVELHLGWAVGIELVVTARVANIQFSSKIEAGGEPSPVTVSFESHGDLTISFT